MLGSNSLPKAAHLLRRIQRSFVLWKITDILGNILIDWISELEENIYLFVCMRRRTICVLLLCFFLTHVLQYSFSKDDHILFSQKVVLLIPNHL